MLHTQDMRPPTRCVAFAAFLATSAQVALAAGFVGPNCDLAEPPEASGEIFNKVGTTTLAGRVYPRLSGIDAGYSGCQILWLSINGGPRQRSVAYIEAGRAR